jgi:hypothetical protein
VKVKISETLEAQQSMSTSTTEDVVQAFIGKSYDYYQRKWELTPGAIKGFNVAAFFLGMV